MKPTDLSLDILLNDDEYRERNEARALQRDLDVVGAERLTGQPLIADADPVLQIRAEGRKERAQGIVHRMDLAKQAGPDVVHSRISHFEQTGDPTGQALVGLDPLKRAQRLRDVAADERVLTFFERHPEAAAMAADDDTLLGQAGKALRFATDRVRAPITGAFTDWYQGEIALRQFEISELLVSSEPSPERDAEVAALRAEQKRLRGKLDKLPKVGDGRFGGSPLEMLDEATFTIGAMGSLITQAARGGVHKAAIAAPIAFTGGFAVGASTVGVASVPVGGVGAIPGGLVIGTGAAITAGGSAFGIGFTSEMAKRMAGHRLAELTQEGWSEDDPATMTNAIVYGTSAALIERMSLGIQWEAMGRTFTGWSPQVARSLGIRVGNWATNPTRAGRIARVAAGIGVSATTEAFEEILQGTLSKSLGDAAGTAAKGRPVEEVWDAALDALEQNFASSLEEGAQAAVSVALLGGLFGPLNVYREGKKAQSAQETEEFLDAWADGQAGSTLMQRSPRLAGEFLGLLTNNTDRSHVYVDPQIFEDALNSEGIGAMEAEQQLPGINEQIQTAKEAGRRIAIPSKDFARAIVPSNLMPHLRPHIVGSPDPTVLSNAQRVEAQKKNLEASGLEDLAQAKDDVIAVQQSLDDSAGVVGLRIAEQLIASGRVSDQQAEVEGQLVAARVRGLAARLSAKAGRLFTPEEVFDLYPLSVLSREQTEAVKAGTTPDASVAVDTSIPAVVDASVPEAPGEDLQVLEQTKKPKRGKKAKLTPVQKERARLKQLATEVPGIAKVLPWLLPEERKRVTRATADNLVAQFEAMPPTSELTAAAVAGYAKRGWYRKSAQAIVDLFGINDAPRFAALLAAFSPQTSVESNLINALSIWANWVKAGRPLDDTSLRAIFGASVQGNKGEDSVLNAWIPNGILSLTAEDPTAIKLSGEKVDSFMNNLREDVNRVTIDAWEGLVLGVADPNAVGSVPVYLAGSAAIRKAAAALTKLTGKTWTPEEVQETTWAWAKALVEKAESKGETRTIAEIVQQEALTDEEIGETPDFAMLFAAGVYRRLAEEAGLDVEAAGRDRSGDGSDGRGAEGEDLRPPRDRFQAALVRAARRLQRTKRDRTAIKAAARAAAAERDRENAFQRTVEFIRLLRSDRASGSLQSRAYARGSGGGSGAAGLLRPTAKAKQLLKALDADASVSFREVDAATYHAAVAAAKAGHKFGAAVEVKAPEEYAAQGMQLFLSADGLSGVVIKPDGDLVSAFSSKGAPAGRGEALLLLGIQQGATKLDCFDTVLPQLYSKMGFVARARMKFNDEFAPEGWDFEVFKKHNAGRPDVIFMRLDPDNAAPYTPGDGRLFDDYDAAVAEQTREDVVVLNQEDNEAPHPLFANDLREFNRLFTAELSETGGRNLVAEYVRDTVRQWEGEENQLLDMALNMIQEDRVSIRQWLQDSTIHPLPPPDESFAAQVTEKGWDLWNVLAKRAMARTVLRAMRSERAKPNEEALYRGIGGGRHRNEVDDLRNPVAAGIVSPLVGEVIDLGGVAGFSADPEIGVSFGSEGVIYEIPPGSASRALDVVAITDALAHEKEFLVAGPFEVLAARTEKLALHRSAQTIITIRQLEPFEIQHQDEVDLETELGLEDPMGQTDEDSTPRARIALTEKQAFVTLAHTSDASSFQHELMHWMLQQMVVMRKLGLADEQMVEDLEALTQWTGASSWQALASPLAERQFAGKADKPHEIVARGWEIFLMEGRAPTAELQPLFTRIRGWVRQVYGGIRAAQQKLGVTLDPDIRRVYDRLFLIESALEEAGVEDGPLIEVKPDDWTDARWKQYQTMWARRTNAALAQVTKRFLPQARRQMRDDLARAMEIFRAEAEAEVANDPGWLAMEFLKRADDGEGLDREALEQSLGPNARGLVEAILARPDQGRGRKLVATTGGVDPEWVAEMVGLRSAGELVEAILAARTVEQRVQERVNREIAQNDEWSEESVYEAAQAAALADREILALVELAHLRQEITKGPGLQDAREAQAATGPLSASEATSEVESAKAALAEGLATGLDAQAIADLQARILAAEAQATASRQGRVEGKVAVRMLREIEARLTGGALRQRAKLLVGEVKANALKRERAAWNTTAATAGKQARKLIATRSFGEAAVQIERELLAHYAAAELNRLIEEFDRGWRLIDRLKKSKTLEALRSPGFDGAAQVVSIMQRYDLRRARPGQPEGQSALGRKLQRQIEAQIRSGEIESLATFVTRLEEERAEVLVIPPWILAGGSPQHWSELPITDFIGIVESLRNIEKVSRAEIKDRKAKRALRLEEVVDSIVGRLEAVNPTRKRQRQNRPPPLSGENIQDMADWADALLLRVADWADFAGGDDIENNTIRQFLVDPIVDSEFEYIALMETLLQPWQDALAKLDRHRMSRIAVIPEMEATGGISTVRYSEIFMMGLHLGTESNMQRLYEGFANSQEHQWSQAGIDAALKLLTDEEWQVIQEVWDAFEALWPRIEQHHFDRTGQHVEKLERREFVSPTGRHMKGGYMVAKYDPRYSERAKAIEDKAAVQGMLGHNYVKSEVQHSHLKSRAQNYSAPLDLNIAVIPRHLDSVVYDLAMREAVADVYKLINHPRVIAAIKSTWSRHHVEALRSMVNDAARVRRAKQQGLLGGVEKISDWLRSSVVYTGLGYRISTGVLQLTGLMPILGEVGTKWSLMALSRATATGIVPFVRRAREASVVLRRRGLTKDRELTEMARNLDGGNPHKAKVDANMGIFIVLGDAFVSSIAWDAQRMKSLHQHGDMKRALREADRAIVRTQGSSTVGEVSALMRAEGFAKWMTLFGGFMSNIYARQRRIVRLAAGKQATEDVAGVPVRKKRPAAATWLFTTSIFLPAVLDALLRGDGPDDDDDESKILWALSRVVSFMGAPVPGVRDVVDYVARPDTRSFQGKAATSRIFELPARVIDDLTTAFDEDEEFDSEELTRSIMLGLTMGRVAPLSQAEVWVDNFWAGEEIGSPRDLIWRKPIERRE